MNFKTQIIAKAQLITPKSDDFRAIASSLKNKYGFDLRPQMDLLYLQSCLVSAGSRVGVNENDDIFTREEAWAARHTPVLKPFNWQHNDKDILGVIYTVQARDLNGNVFDINQSAVPDTDFDLWTEAAIFRLVHQDRAKEIEIRSKANDLFVSMEAWFDDYGYGMCSDNNLVKTVARNESTNFLDKHLRASGGVGKYRDPESGQEMRIGRVLRSITFGGCGLVDRPANKRSIIDSAEPMTNFDEIELLLHKVLESTDENLLQEVTAMNAQANSQGVKPEDMKVVIASVLDERDQIAAKAREEAQLKARASEAEVKSEELEAKVAELNQAIEVKNQEVKSLSDQTTAYNEAVRKLIEEHVAAAGVSNDTPSEIAKIDSAKSGDEAFTAKIAWIQNSLAGLRAKAARADELDSKLAEAETVVREQDIRSLLGDVVSEEALETFVSHASKLDNEQYTHWRDEKELMVLEMIKAAKKAVDEESDPNEKEPDDDEDDMPFPPKGKKGKKMKDAKASNNPFRALLEKHRSEGEANPDTMNGNPNEPNLINHPAGDGVKSGVNPGKLRTPRYKIAGGTAGNDPSRILDKVKSENGLQFAGASPSGDEGEGVNPFRVLANLVTAHSKLENEESDAKPKKPGFDPVQ